MSKVNETSNREVAQNYLGKGMVPIPVKYMEKAPAISGWSDRTLTNTDIIADFPTGQDQNIGVVLGKASQGIVDIDLDCQEAILMASMFLPDTGMVFGRDGAPSSHRIYTVSDCGGSNKFQGPGDEGVLVEYRGTGAQTVFPPSTHTSGELIRFDHDGDPGQVDHETLHQNASRLAAASLIARHWTSGKRHEIAMALSGTLLRAGWFDDDVEEFVEAVCVGTNDNEVQDRLRAVQDTAKAVEAGDPSTGLTRLKQLIGDDVVRCISEWLELGRLGHNSIVAKEDFLRCSDIGNASVFAGQRSHELRYCYDLGAWLAWADKVWMMDDKASVDRMAELTVRSFPVEAKSIKDTRDQEEFLKWTMKSGSRPRVKAMVEQSRHHMQIDQDSLDDHPMLFNAGGSMVNLEDGTHRQCLPDDFSTKMANAKHDPDAECPLFKAFLDKIMAGSEELKSYLQRAAGYSLTGSTKEQCFFIAHGSGANGKSVFLNLLRDLMGSYALNIPMDTLTEKTNGGGIPNDIARLLGSRMVTAMEGESNQKMSQSLVKHLTGGDKMTARFLFKEFFDFVPELKLWMGTNHKPKISGDDPAIWRRVHLIPFDVVIPAEEQDHDLPQKLREELPGILNWAVEGAVAWNKKGLQPPNEVLAATKGYKSEMDTFSRFCGEIIVRKVGAKTTKKGLHDAYLDWYREEGGEELTMPDLNTKMKQLGYEEGRSSRQRYWKDVEVSCSDLF